MAIVPVVILIAVFFIDWISGLILLVTGPLIPVFMSLIGMRAQQQVQKQWSTLRYLSTHFLDAIQGLRTLKLFNQSDRKHSDIAHVSDRFRISTMGVLKIAFLSGFVLELFASIATALVAVEIGVRLIEGHIGFQVGLFVLLLAPEYYLPFRMFGAQHHAGMEGAESAGRIFAILDSDDLLNKVSFSDSNSIIDQDKTNIYSQNAHVNQNSSKRYHEEETGLQALEKEVHYPLVFQDVTFSYLDKRSPVLTKCNFNLPGGKRTALVGLTGSGKTTILRLLTRQLPAESGAIFLNGITAKEMDENTWLRNMAVVSQTSWFFDDTVLANLRAARLLASYEEVLVASRAAGAHDFIEKLPEGYQTPTGEFAARFSGGERQRISIARAFLKDAPILILDEPSSALDPESEEKINSDLDKMMVGKTVFLIAHRISTVSRADRILMLENGRITAQGTHEQLLAKCNLYYQMVSAYSGKIS